ncbi:protein artichoke isoform X2 [Cephus cinctus]|uniref:Protein artichoke isoform X2 n=1 Tax=Cephus cinctus TaxID=211228 RepID=A0AAJ7RC43_CEPCN|nr:protein artichoke isoform X2 [Cephus cinctus]
MFYARHGISNMVGRCSHSELPKVLAGLEAVSHYVARPVDELILENNNLPSLPGRTFASLRVLRLMLRNNRLERVSSGWLEGLHDSLLELFMVEPDLRSLPIDSLDNLQGLEAITLQSQSMMRLPRFSGLPKLRYLQINSAALLELTPTNFRDLPNLEQLHIFGSDRLIRLEAGLLRDLPRLKLVNISDCGISWIHPRSMISLPELKEISLVGNSIGDATMVGRAATDLPMLSVIRLDRNRITRLGEASFMDLPMLNRLYLSRNRISEIFPGAFQRMPMLRIIDLNHNSISRIHPEFLPQRTGNSLEEMWLINNDLSHVAELRSVLEALPRLKFLDASYNQLEEIPFGALRGHRTLERLHLDHNRLNFLQRETFTAMPALRELRLRNNSLTNLIEVPFWNLPALKGLDLSENYFRHIEPRLLANLPNLRRLDLSGNSITLIEPQSFMRVPALEHINISRNALSAIHPMTFRHLSNLYELDIGWNRLVEVVPGLPRNIEHLHMPMNRILVLPPTTSPDLALPVLKSLDISANGIERISPGSLNGLSNLRKLNFGYNSLRLLEDGTFDGLSRLEQLDLRNNNLVSIHGRSFRSMGILVDLNLMGNRLEMIRPEIFQENSRLEILDLSRNHLKHIPHATFINTRDLRELYASHNTLTELPGSLHDLKGLQVLDLSFNNLNILSPETLSSLTSLLELKLVRNKIRELKEGAFDRLPRLSLIDLENNDLRVIERNAIRALPELQALRLGKNRLQSIPNGAFSELPLLQSAELQENHLQEIAGGAFINVPHLLFLNLSYNMLPSLDHVGLESLRSLEVLDLSNNRLSRIASESLAPMEWLVELKMDNNRICTIQGSPFDDMPRLRVLSLRNNRMASVSENAFKRLRSNIAILDIDGNPLSCSCGMLWLRGWLQQASADGPRCADGSLFREIRLSREDCQRERQVEHVLPGCEAEVISTGSPSSASSSLFGNAEGVAPWMNLKNPTSLPPLPNESDYFYDEYVDYPYENSSLSSFLNSTALPTTLPPSPEVSQAIPEQLQSQPVTISEDTTAGTAKQRNKTLPGKHMIPPSPSSSGFTFFGVPIPSLNFNLWGTAGRKADRKNDFSGRPGKGSHRVYPPTEPEIHRGGFVPLPRGQSGFVPIVDPWIAYREKKSNETLKNRHSNEMDIKYQEDHKKVENFNSSTEKSQLSSGRRQTVIKIREELSTVRNMPLITSVSKNSSKVPFNGSQTTESTTMADDYTTAATDEITAATEIYKGERLDEDADETKHFSGSQGEVASRIVWTTPKSKAKETIRGGSKETITATMEVFEAKKSSYWNREEHFNSKESTTEAMTTIMQDIVTDNPNIMTTDKTLSTQFLSTMTTLTTIRPTENPQLTSQAMRNMEASALSTFLVPGGQIPVIANLPRPVGRSTITKVPSPNYASTAEQYHNNDRDKLQADAADKGFQEYRQQEVSTTRVNESTDNTDENMKLIEDSSFNWYFQHYNDTNLESFVGVVYSCSVDKTTICSWTLIVVQIYFLLCNL